MGIAGAIDITPGQRRTISGLLKKHLPNVTVWAYGSRVKWTADPQSDLDLAAFASAEQKRQVSDLREAFDESDLPFRVDLFIWDEVPDEFRGNIEAEHVVVQERQRGTMGGALRKLPLGRLYDFRSGLSKPRSEFGSGYGFLSFKDVFYNFFVPEELSELVNSTTQEQEACSIKMGDVFLTRTSETMEELGMSCVALKDYEKATFNGFTKRLRAKPNTQIVPEYAGYFFRSPTFRRAVTAMSSLSTRASLNNEMLGRLEMILPSFDEQKAIGFILKTLDDKIELNRQMNRTLEQMAQAIFKSWFIDFDPVRAKAANRDPGLPKEIADLFPDSFEDSELGEIPKGWGVKPLSVVAHQIVDCLHSKKPDPIVNGKRMIQVFNIGDHGRLTWAKEFLVSDDDFKEWTKRIRPRKGDIFVTKTGRVGAVAQLMYDEEVSFGRNLVVLRPDPSKYPPHLMRTAMTSSFMKKEIERNTTDGTILKSLHVKHIAKLRLLVAPPPVVAAAEKILAATGEKLVINDRENSKLKSLCDTLLPKLISGELRIPDAEKLLEGVA